MTDQAKEKTLRYGDVVVFVSGPHVGRKATFIAYHENDGVHCERGRDHIYCPAEYVKRAGGDDAR